MPPARGLGDSSDAVRLVERDHLERGCVAARREAHEVSTVALIDHDERAPSSSSTDRWEMRAKGRTADLPSLPTAHEFDEPGPTRGFRDHEDRAADREDGACRAVELCEQVGRRAPDGRRRDPPKRAIVEPRDDRVNVTCEPDDRILQHDLGRRLRLTGFELVGVVDADDPAEGRSQERIAVEEGDVLGCAASAGQGRSAASSPPPARGHGRPRGLDFTRRLSWRFESHSPETGDIGAATIGDDWLVGVHAHPVVPSDQPPSPPASLSSASRRI